MFKVEEAAAAFIWHIYCLTYSSTVKMEASVPAKRQAFSELKLENKRKLKWRILFLFRNIRCDAKNLCLCIMSKLGKNICA
jgi:hypothetical protein